MKTKMLKFIITTTIVVIASFNFTSAQNWTRVDPKMTKVLADTTLVQAYVATLAPGEKSTSHTHPAAFIYALTSGKLKVTYSDGKTENFELKEGDAMYGDAERPHVTENAGTAVCKFLLVELKEHPYKEKAKK